MTIFIKYLASMVDIIVIMLPLLPLILTMVKYLGRKTKQKNIELLADRGLIIVRSLEKNTNQLSNPERKGIALDKILEYANEIGINLTKEQANDFIESAVVEINAEIKRFE